MLFSAVADAAQHRISVEHEVRIRNSEEDNQIYLVGLLHLSCPLISVDYSSNYSYRIENIATIVSDWNVKGLHKMKNQVKSRYIT